MTTSRREFLAAGAAGALGAAGLSLGGPLARRVFAAPEREIALKQTLVVLFLRGGQDALNTLVPYSDGLYYDMRPTIAVPTPDKPNGAIDLDGTFGLNPGLAGFKTLWDERILAPVCNVGLGHPSRSHFACQDFMEFGDLGNAPRRGGWLNRYLAATAPAGAEPGELRAVALQGRLPRSLRGPYPVLAVDPARTLRRQGEDVLDLFADVYKRTPGMTGPEMGAEPGMGTDLAGEDDLVGNGRTTIETLRRLETILAEKPAGKEATYAASLGYLGQQLRMAARVIKSGRGVEVIGLDWNGWDHHIQEGGAAPNDLIRRMLTVLGDSLATFYEDIRPMRSYVTTVVMTEFGRTNHENGNFGTDHGHGGAMWVIGGKVRGGKVHGEWSGLAAGKTYEDRDLPVTTDWRQVLTEILGDHMKHTSPTSLFKGFTPTEKRLGLFTS